MKGKRSEKNCLVKCRVFRPYKFYEAYRKDTAFLNMAICPACGCYHYANPLESARNDILSALEIVTKKGLMNYEY